MANGDHTRTPEQWLAELDLKIIEFGRKLEEHDLKVAEHDRLLHLHDEKVATHDLAVAEHDRKVAPHDGIMADLIKFKEMYRDFITVRHEVAQRESRFTARFLELTTGDTRTRQERQRKPRED